MKFAQSCILQLVLTSYCLATSYSSLFNNTLDYTWNNFWDSSKSAWSENESCLDDFANPPVWLQAVAGKVVADSLNIDRINSAVANMKDYLNTDTNWFSASTAKDDDVYMDDNSQVLWVLLDSYKYAGNVDDLTLAKKLMKNIQGQEASGGGVYWKLNAPYIASISTAELALAATRLYQETLDPLLLTFASNQINWLFNNLQDPDDGLFYDGITDTTGDVDTGKLTYSVGVSVSTLAYLTAFTGNHTYYDQAEKLLKSALDKDGPFFTDGYLNNKLRYSTLLFVGISDLLTLANPTTLDQDDYYQELITLVTDQAQHIVDTNQVSSNNFVDSALSFKADSSNYCDGSVIGNLLDNVSAAQIFYSVSRVASS